MKKINKLLAHTIITVYPDRKADIEIEGRKTKIMDVRVDEGHISGFEVFAGYMFGMPMNQLILEGDEHYDLCYEAAKNAKMFEIEKSYNWR